MNNINKWKPIFESLGITNSHWGNISQLAENQSKQILEENTLASEESNTEFTSILPISMKVAAKTIGFDLVSVQPLARPGMSQEEVDRINNEVKKENRDGKIDALIEGKDFKEMKPEEHPDWRPGPIGHLFYSDFKYGTQNEEEKDDSPIKGRRGPKNKN